MKRLLALTCVLCTGFFLSNLLGKDEKKMDNRLFEMRIYYAAKGKMDDLNARFRNHTTKLFEKHGMTLIGFWNPTDPEKKEQKLIYILAHANKEAADKSWKAFREDADWVKARTESEKNGKLVDKIEVEWMAATDYSALK